MRVIIMKLPSSFCLVVCLHLNFSLSVKDSQLYLPYLMFSWAEFKVTIKKMCSLTFKLCLVNVLILTSFAKNELKLKHKNLNVRQFMFSSSSHMSFVKCWKYHFNFEDSDEFGVWGWYYLNKFTLFKLLFAVNKTTKKCSLSVWL